jgi:LacI family transcriptional regulator
MRPRRVGIAIDLDWPIPHHQGVVSGALKYAREKGWACEIDPFIGFPGAASGGFDGVIGRVTRELAAWAARTRTPAVNVWSNSPSRKLPLVAVDYAAAGRLAAEHLGDRGLRKFGFIGRENDAAARLHLEGFRRALSSRGFGVDVLLVPGEPQNVEGWIRLQKPLRRWVSSWRSPIGVLASVDILARHLCNACQHASVRIPDDVAILGSGNTALLCDLLEPTISSLEHGYERVGRRAAELLDALMAGQKAPVKPLLLPPSGVVSRRSSDMFAVDDPSVVAALRAIWAGSSRPLKVSSILQGIPTSRRTLERRFRETLGRTIHDEIRRAHVEQAKRLLVETRESLKVVAARAGFSDPQQFSRVFRSSEGLTPQRYRRLHAGR